MSQFEPSPAEKNISENEEFFEVVMGFVGWYVINGLFWLGARGNDSLIGFTCPGNFIVLLICVINPSFRRVAAGILIALALNFFISLVSGMTTNAFCFVPFFNR